MGRSATFGIVGGHGATGRVVVSELLKSGEGDILIAGRDKARLESFASELGSRVSTAFVDVLDARSLDAFCERCSIVVNCSGPVMLLQDRVAQAAFRHDCHYVDPAGMSLVRERLAAHSGRIADSGLSFVLSAGWAPGLAEVLPAYAYAQAKSRMDSIESMKVYFSDSGEWSSSALRDGVWHLRHTGISKPGYFRKGEWARARMSEASVQVDLGDPIGLRRFSLFSMPELNAMARGFADCEVFTYSYVAGVRNAVSATAIALLPLPESLAVRLLRDIFRRNRLPVGGFIRVHLRGRSEGRDTVLKARIEFEEGRGYPIHGIVLATACRMLAAGNGIRAGLHYLFDAADPAALIGELRKQGVRETETFEVVVDGEGP